MDPEEYLGQANQQNQCGNRAKKIDEWWPVITFHFYFFERWVCYTNFITLKNEEALEVGN
jgi:hypothetical protein